MKMLEIPEYALFEIHEFGERRLGLDEKPLLGKMRLESFDWTGEF